MNRRSLLAALTAGAAGLAGCGDRGTPSGEPPPGTGSARTTLTFENRGDATWVAEVTFVDQPFDGATVTTLDGSERSLDVATTEQLFDRLDDSGRVADVAFDGGATEIIEWTAPPGDAREWTVPTWEEAGMVALLFREDAADDPDQRAFLHTSCEGQASVIATVALLVDSDGSRSMQAQCSEP